MRIPDPAAVHHGIETYARWGAYLLLAGIGALLVDARVGLALIPIGAAVLLSGAYASAHPRDDAYG
jgi:hypothetical protein